MKRKRKDTHHKKRKREGKERRESRPGNGRQRRYHRSLVRRRGVAAAAAPGGTECTGAIALQNAGRPVGCGRTGRRVLAYTHRKRVGNQFRGKLTGVTDINKQRHEKSDGWSRFPLVPLFFVFFMVVRMETNDAPRDKVQGTGPRIYQRLE